MASLSVLGYAASAKGQRLEPITYEAPKLGEHDVRVSITHCGVCYTDIQAIDDFYGISTYPFVPGHEVVGSVSEVGSAVSELKIGDRVGIGWQGRSCMQCEWCLEGEEQLCEDIANCGMWKPYGGFASSVVVESRFTYLLPPSMPSEIAAVLMCAGISVYSPLRAYAKENPQKIGIVGVGGLGHLAIQFAHAMGYEVTAISTSAGKEQEALTFGANHFIYYSDKESMGSHTFSFDLLLYTSHVKGDWTPLVNSLKTNGRFVIIGFPDDVVSFDPMELVVRQYSITGSFIGNRATMREMLAFAQDHQIKPKIELMPMAYVNEAIQKIKENKARYRMVLFNETTGG